MKRQQHFLLTLALMLCSVLNINAAVLTGSCGTDLTYSLDTKTFILEINGTGDMDFFRNNYYDGHYNAPWYQYSSFIKTVIIGNGVTSISSYAFCNCSELTSVTIGNSVTSIKEDAFSGCSGLTKVEFASIESLCKISFENYASNPLYFAKNLYVDGQEVKDLVIPNSITSIGSYTFHNCSRLTSVTIPNSVTSIGNYAFYNCSGFTSVTIPNSVTSIGSDAFWGCTSIEEVIVALEDNKDFERYLSRTDIESVFYATNGSHKILIDGVEQKDIVIPDNITKIGAYAFYLCRGITSVTIPKGVTEIGEEAFSCYGLESVVWNARNCKTYSTYYGSNNSPFPRTVKNFTFGEDVVSIPSYLCYKMDELSSITIPKNVVSIGSKAFDGCSGLTKVEYASIESLCKMNFGGSSANPLSFTQKLYIEGKEIKDLVIPNGVTSIRNYAFYNCSDLTSVTIPDGVTSIGSYAFYNCSDLPSVTIPDGVTSIGSYAFYGCSKLTSVAIPNSVTSIGSLIFDKCSSLTSVTINSNAITSKTYTFSNTISSLFGDQVKEYILGESIKSIGKYAFYRCSNLSSVTIGNGVTSIGSDAFYGCSKLHEVYNLSNLNIQIGNTDLGYVGYYAKLIHTSLDEPTIYQTLGDFLYYDLETPLLYEYTGDATNLVLPDDIKGKSYEIGSSVFSDHSEITSVTIGKCVESIGAYAFDGCSGLTSVTIPNNVTSIDSKSFRGCSGLTSVTIGNSVESIGAYAFSGCSGLTSVTIGNGVTSIGTYAFDGCSGLTKAEFASIESLCKIRFSNYSANPLYYAKHLYIDGKEVKDLVIPNGVTSIGDYAFLNCSSLTSVTILGSVTSIGSSAFDDCSGLTKAEFASVESLCKINFGYSNNPLCYAKHLYIDGKEVKDLIIPNSVTSIGSYTFSNCSGLTSVTIPNSVTSIGSNAFYGCSKLYEVYNLSSLSLTIGGMDNGKVAYYAKVIHTSLDEPSIYEEIDGFKFLNLETPQLIGYTGNETDLSLPNDFKGKSYIIGSNAFSGRSDLTSVTISNNVTSIGSEAFSGCLGLTSVTISNNVTSIGSEAFSGCLGLTSVSIGSGVTSIGGDAFANCGSLQKAEFASIEALCKIDFGSWAANPLRLANHIYVDGQEVTDVVIPESVTEIKDYTFYNCNYITSVSIPNSVKRIGACSFSSCLKLRSLVVPNSVESIGNAAFYNCKFTSVLFGDDLVMIEGNIFDSRAKISKNLVCMSVIPPASKNDICNNDEIYANTQLLVPEESVELYKTANYWKKFQNIKGFVGEPFVMGDADGDGTITMGDANTIVNDYLGSETDIEPLAGDVDGDRKITMSDANAIVNMYLSK